MAQHPDNAEVITNLYSGDEIRKMFGVTAQTLRRWRLERNMPYVLLVGSEPRGDVIRYRFKKVVAWAKRNKIKVV